jgi:hypothetical protein
MCQWGFLMRLKKVLQVRCGGRYPVEVPGAYPAQELIMLSRAFLIPVLLLIMVTWMMAISAVRMR